MKGPVATVSFVARLPCRHVKPMQRYICGTKRLGSSDSRGVGVAIVDEDHAVREAVVYMLELAADFNCCGSFSRAREALVKIPMSSPALVLIALRLPDLNGIECTRRLKGIMPRVRFKMGGGVL